MGFLKERHGMMMLGNTPPGTCPECAVKHDPQQPHNRDSLAYQYKFYDKHGRWPTWADAMEHCPQEIKDYWKQALAKRGVQVVEDDYNWDDCSTIKSDSELLRLVADREIKEMEIDGNSKELKIRI